MRQTPTTGRHAYALAGILGALLLAAACSTDSISPDPCTGPTTVVIPETVTFAVGDTVIADLRLIGPPQCRPVTVTRSRIRWRSEDTTIVRVNTNKGYVVGAKAGQANIIAYIPADGSTWGLIPVTVTP